MKPVLPDDLEIALLYPQTHPAMAELITKLCVLDAATERAQMKPGESFPYSVAAIALTEYVSRVWFPAPPPPPTRFGIPIVTAAAATANGRAAGGAAANGHGSGSGSAMEDDVIVIDKPSATTNGNGHINPSSDSSSDTKSSNGVEPTERAGPRTKRKASGDEKSKSRKAARTDSNATAAAAASNANDANYGSGSGGSADATSGEDGFAPPMADRFDPRREFPSNPFNPANAATDCTPKRLLFHELSLDLRIRLLSAFCDYRLFQFEEFRSGVNAVEPDQVRMEPIGYDANGSAYFCFQFDDYRIYRQHASNKPKARPSDDTSSTANGSSDSKKGGGGKKQPTELFSIFKKKSAKGGAAAAAEEGKKNGRSKSNAAAAAAAESNGTDSTAADSEVRIEFPTDEEWRRPYLFELVCRTASQFESLLNRLKQAQKKRKNKKEKELIDALTELSEELSTSATATGKRKRPNSYGRILESLDAKDEAPAEEEETASGVGVGGRKGSRSAAAAAVPELLRKRSSRIQVSNALQPPPTPPPVSDAAACGGCAVVWCGVGST